MENFKIYRERKYDLKANLALKVSVLVPKIIQKLDDGFYRLYEF